MCGASEVMHDFGSVPSDQVLQIVRDTIRLSLPAIRTDASQFAGQLIGRLAHAPDQEIWNLLSNAWEYDGKPWLRPLVSTLIQPGSALLRFLSGHSKNVEAVAITRDGSRAVSVAKDRILLLWKLPDRADPITLTGTAKAVSVIDIADTGDVAGSIDHGGILTIWDLISFKELRNVEVDPASVGVNALFLLRNGHEALLQYEGSAPILWDVRTASPIVELQVGNRIVTALAIAEKAG
jgi:WD40 repeat protein